MFIMINRKKLSYLFCFFNLNTANSTQNIKLNNNIVNKKQLKKNVLEKVKLKGKKITSLSTRSLKIGFALLEKLNKEAQSAYKIEENYKTCQMSYISIKDEFAKKYKIFKIKERKEKERKEKERKEKEKQELLRKQKEIELANMNSKLNTISKEVKKETKIIKKIVKQNKTRNEMILSLLFGLIIGGLANITLPGGYAVAYGLYGALMSFGLLNFMNTKGKIMKNKLIYTLKFLYLGFITMLLYFFGPKTNLFNDMFGDFSQQLIEDEGKDIGELFPQQQEFIEKIENLFK